MLVKCQRPPACQVLAAAGTPTLTALSPLGSTRRRSAVVVISAWRSWVNSQRLYRNVVDKTFAAVAEHRFEEAHLKGGAEVETLKRLASTRRRGSLKRLGDFPYPRGSDKCSSRSARQDCLDFGRCARFGWGGMLGIQSKSPQATLSAAANTEASSPC